MGSSFVDLLLGDLGVDHGTCAKKSAGKFCVCVGGMDCMFFLLERPKI